MIIKADSDHLGSIEIYFVDSRISTKFFKEQSGQLWANNKTKIEKDTKLTRTSSPSTPSRRLESKPTRPEFSWISTRRSLLLLSESPPLTPSPSPKNLKDKKSSLSPLSRPPSLTNRTTNKTNNNNLDLRRSNSWSAPRLERNTPHWAPSSECPPQYYQSEFFLYFEFHFFMFLFFEGRHHK